MCDTVQRLRRELPSLADEVYLNTGAAGPLPRCAADAIAAAATRASNHSRLSFSAYLALDAARAELRAELADLLGGEVTQIALTTSVTAGLGHVISGLDLRAGDEVITTNLEHPALSLTLALMGRKGVRVRVVELATGAEDLEPLLAPLVGPRTKLVALSHVTWTTGARVDVEGAARVARAVGAFVLVDGAQAIGSIPVDPVALGADAYVFPAQKWLLGPEGLAAVWISDAALERVDPPIAGLGHGVDHGPDGSVTPHPDARRLELGMLPDLLVPGWLASLRWCASVADGEGWAWIYERSARVSETATRTIEQVGAAMIGGQGRRTGLVAFTLPGVAPESASAQLEKQHVIVRPVPYPRALRVSVGFFTDENDIERLCGALSDLVG